MTILRREGQAEVETGVGLLPAGGGSPASQGPSRAGLNTDPVPTLPKACARAAPTPPCAFACTHACTLGRRVARGEHPNPPTPRAQGVPVWLKGAPHHSIRGGRRARLRASLQQALLALPVPYVPASFPAWWGAWATVERAHTARAFLRNRGSAHRHAACAAPAASSAHSHQGQTAPKTHMVWLLSVHTQASLVPLGEKARACTPRLPCLQGRGGHGAPAVCRPPVCKQVMTCLHNLKQTGHCYDLFLL